MSRRKQKNPSHLTDEGEAMEVTSLEHMSACEHEASDDESVSSLSIASPQHDTSCPLPYDPPTHKTTGGTRYPNRALEGFTCPSCPEIFRSKRAFNTHILVHCQLPNGSNQKQKRQCDPAMPATKKAKKSDNSLVKGHLSHHNEADVSVPLDLSCHKSLMPSDEYQLWATSPRDSLSPPLDTSEERGLLDDEHDNRLNEAREHVSAFFDESHNEFFLREDSTGFDAPPTLPLYQTGGVTRKLKVCSNNKPMTYRVKLHSEQILASRILGTNEETGDKMELYKCFVCRLTFASISRLQAHLIRHKQQFVCKKCSFSCDSRLQFSTHVQKAHLLKAFRDEQIRVLNEAISEDSNGAENSVPVAALLSALRPESVMDVLPSDEHSPLRDADDDRKSDESNPESPDLVECNKDMFKMYSCKFCDKKFDRAFSCNRHERIHTGYKPCFCDICGRGFSEPRNLRHHVIRFHSDGKLRYLIKRDRRKRQDGSRSPTPPLSVNDSPSSPTHVPHLNSQQLADYSSFSSSLDSKNFQNFAEQIGAVKSEDVSVYTSNLTKIFAGSLDKCSRGKRSNDNAYESIQPDNDNNNGLEPGEIRLGRRTKIVDDDEKGRHIVYTDDHSEETMDHSPQFSSYAPRLNIVQNRVNRDKALAPITDEIGRTFYECPYCRKFFGSTSDLNRHLDFHEDLRPYDCDYCSYSARTNSQLKVHKMRHEGIKQYSCEVCNYNGVTQSDLNRHKKTQSHLTRLQNLCSMCHLGFYSVAQKQVHVVQCHPEMEGASSLIQMSLGVPLDAASPCKDMQTFALTNQPPSEPNVLAVQ